MKVKLWMVLLILLVITVALIPKFYLEKHDVADSFIYSHSSISQSNINDETISFRPYSSTANTINRHANGQSTRFVTPLIVGMLGSLTGESISNLQFAPICGIILLFLGFVIARKITGSTILASCFVIILAYEPTANSLTNATYLQGWGFILYFVVILIVLLWYDKVKNQLFSKNLKLTILTFALIAILLLVSEFTYYTTTFYIILLMCFVVFVLIIKIIRFIEDKKKRRKMIIWMSIIIGFLIALFVIFDPAVSFAQSGGNIIGSFFDFLGDVASRIGDLIGGGSGAVTGLETGYTIESGAALTSNNSLFIGLIWYIIMGIPILILSWRILIRFLRKRKIPGFYDGLFICLGLTGFLNLIIYNSLGLFDLKYQAILYPLLSLYALNRIVVFRWQNKGGTSHSNIKGKISNSGVFMATTIVVLIICLTFAKFELKYPMYSESLSYDEDSQNYASVWLVGVHGNNDQINTISDLRMSGRIMLSTVSAQHTNFDSYVFQSWFLPVFITDNDTRRIEIFEENNLEYVFLSERNAAGHFSIGGWKTAYVNTSAIHDFTNNITYIQKVYSNTDVNIYKKS